jgi:hypothetical protein
VLKRRVPRVLVAGFLLAVAVSGLSACRTSPDVAAYVGDAQVTVTELDSAVAERLTDENIAAYADGKEDQFTRRVLSLLVQEDVYAAAAERYHVQVSDDDVRARIAELLGNDNPDDVYSQLAQQGVGREDVFENVRQQLIRQQIADSQGQVTAPTESELQARYETEKQSLAKVSFGYLTVPDQATATAVLAQLTASPDAYPALAAQFPGAYTLPALETRAPDKIPSVLAEGIATAAPNTGFTTAVPEAGGVVVTFVAGTVYPPFEEVRPQLEKEASDQADAAGKKLVDDVQSHLGVTVNPRYGVLKDGQLTPGTGGVVDILEEDAAAAAAAAPSTAPAG